MTGWMTGWMTGVALPTSPGRSPPDLPTLAARSGTERRARLDLGAWELGGDVLGLLQDRVEVLCLDEFVGLQMLEGPDAAHRQAGRGRRPGIGEVHDDEPVVLAEHQVVGLQLAPGGLHRLGHHHDPVAWLGHGPGDGLALEGEKHRILRHRATNSSWEPASSAP